MLLAGCKPKRRVDASYRRPKSRRTAGRYPGFEEMRAGLVQWGLIDAEHRITPAGLEYAARVVAEKRAEHRLAVRP